MHPEQPKPANEVEVGEKSTRFPVSWIVILLFLALIGGVIVYTLWPVAKNDPGIIAPVPATSK